MDDRNCTKANFGENTEFRKSFYYFIRLLAIAAMLTIEVLPATAHPCNWRHPTPENPTIILSLVGGSIIMWRYARGRVAK